MTHRNDPFRPEVVEENVQQLLQAASRLHAPVEPDTRFVRDVRLATIDHRQTGERVWSRLAERLTGQALTPNHLNVFTNETVSNEGFSPMSPKPLPFPFPPAIQSSTTPRSRPRVLTLVAVLFVAILLVGSTITVVSRVPQGSPVSTAGKPTQTRTPTGSSSVIPFPAQDCPTVSGATRDATWYQLCEAGQFVMVNQSRTLQGGYTITLLAAYADRNWLYLLSDVSPIDLNHMALVDNRVQTQQGSNLLGLDGSSFRGRGQHFLSEFRYDTSHLPATLHTLLLHVHAGVSIATPKSFTLLSPVDFASVSVPVMQ